MRANIQGIRLLCLVTPISVLAMDSGSAYLFGASRDDDGNGTMDVCQPPMQFPPAAPAPGRESAKRAGLGVPTP
jgi:hypothetical protein